MVTSLTTLESSGPLKAVVAIAVVFGLLWLIMYFVEPIHRFLGRLVCTVFSKVMCLFIAAIGVHMIMTGLQHYFN
jgi:small neutral amino acid transporter SnatA (MarC family)